MESPLGSFGASGCCTSSAPECCLSQASPIGSGTIRNGCVGGIGRGTVSVRIESRPFPSLLSSSDSRNRAPRGMASATVKNRFGRGLDGARTADRFATPRPSARGGPPISAGWLAQHDGSPRIDNSWRSWIRRASFTTRKIPVESGRRPPDDWSGMQIAATSPNSLTLATLE